MYEELEKSLRDYAAVRKGEIAELTSGAADAIEKLQARVKENDDWWAMAKTLVDMVAPKWIPVTERLPEEYVGVLCYCSRNGQYGCGEWCKEDNGTIYWIGLNGMIPTHWMPLPEPPKEEQK